MGSKAKGSEGSMGPGRLSSAERTELILNHRESAQKLGMKLLRGWGARLENDDFVSAVDLALCESAKRYTPSDRATFVTYLFYFIKGELLETLRANGSTVAAAALAMPDEHIEGIVTDEMRNESDPLEHIGDNSASPDKITYLRELRAACLDAMSELSDMEREVLIEREIMDEKMATVVARTGYSRGHLFLLQKQATDKMRVALAPLQSEWVAE